MYLSYIWSLLRTLESKSQYSLSVFFCFLSEYIEHVKKDHFLSSFYKAASVIYIINTWMTFFIIFSKRIFFAFETKSGYFKIFMDMMCFCSGSADTNLAVYRLGPRGAYRVLHTLTGHSLKVSPPSIPVILFFWIFSLHSAAMLGL